MMRFQPEGTGEEGGERSRSDGEGRGAQELKMEIDGRRKDGGGRGLRARQGGSLAEELLKRKITMVGTVRKNKPELPPALLASKEREVFSSKFALTPTTTLVSYLPKKNKNVVLLSTLHTDSDISDRGDRKPVIILDYNRNKGGVDNLDKVIGTYSCRRMTARWPLVIFHNIIDVSSYNAFVLWREINPTWMSRKQNKRRVFLEQLGKALVTPLIERRKHVPCTEASAAVVKAIQSAGAPDQPEDLATTATSPARAIGNLQGVQQGACGVLQFLGPRFGRVTLSHPAEALKVTWRGYKHCVSIWSAQLG
ncbi:hypothetical protein L3Q82_002020 [Scortum barcoo]|uniref:Uncharacterized protein n=1 Tax=Scortum barcoo TaxID=214431 RepID=A0ACB8W1H6_9TELE|nr:hypothetical protein L3Q82_002020 [Scortum barcoo]